MSAVGSPEPSSNCVGILPPSDPSMMLALLSVSKAFAKSSIRTSEQEHSLLRRQKARFLSEPSLVLDSAMVALHAHGGDVRAQGFQVGFLCWTSPLKSSPSDIPMLPEMKTV